MDKQFEELLHKLDIKNITLFEAYTNVLSHKARSAIYNNLLIKYRKQTYCEDTHIKDIETDIALQNIKYSSEENKN